MDQETYDYLIPIAIVIIICILSYLYSFRRINIYDILDNHYYKPKLYCFWTGTNNMTENRIRNLKTLNNTGFDVVLITQDNLNSYLLNGYPLHKGYKYLSETHKADYLRCYFMNFYGFLTYFCLSCVYFYDTGPRSMEIVSPLANVIFSVFF